ncbi:MAG: hypothetical protein OEW15_17860 [Nitrospirota bacterium]|nr:hypothetical protein [Nitrospirota bacterium]
MIVPVVAIGQGKPPAALVQGMIWTGIYFALLVATLIVLLAGTPPASRGFWRELSAALGYAGMAVLGVQFALTARFRRAAANSTIGPDL